MMRYVLKIVIEEFKRKYHLGDLEIDGDNIKMTLK
jgi:hypothetical protein